MDALVLVIEIVLCLFALFMIAVVLLQSGKSAGLSGDIAGGAEQFFGKTKAKSYEGTLRKLTKVAAIGMLVLSIGLVVIQVYFMSAVAEDAETTDEVTVEETATTDESDGADAEATEASDESDEADAEATEALDESDETDAEATEASDESDETDAEATDETE